MNGARAMGMDASIGALEVGKKADFVLHDTDRPEWGPVFDAVGQLAESASPAGVHSVWIDGVRVVADGHATLIDEAEADRRRQAGRPRPYRPHRAAHPNVLAGDVIRRLAGWRVIVRAGASQEPRPPLRFRKSS